MANAWAKRTYATTLGTATRHREGWTSDELEFVTTFHDVSDAELARALGRTLYAIWTIKVSIREGRPVGSTRRASRGYVGWVEGMGDE
jgi:hypothetical protein